MQHGVFCFAQIEELGSEGRVEEAQGMMKLVEQLKEERELLSSTPSVSQLTSLNRPTDTAQDSRCCSCNAARLLTRGFLSPCEVNSQSQTKQLNLAKMFEPPAQNT